MKHITVAVPEDVYREARIRAAERDTSVSALVAEYLRSLAGRASEFSRLEEQQRDIQAGISAFRGGDMVSRDQIHDRALR